MQSPSVRQLAQDDASQFQSLRLSALQDAPEAFGSSYEEERLVTLEDWALRLTPSENSAVFGAWQNGQLAGCAGLYRQRALKQLHKGVIWGVYVAPAQRGRGVARQLMLAVLARAGQMPGLRALQLTVAKGNAAAEKLYSSLGFEAYGTEPRGLCVNGRDIDEILMWKPLEG